MKEGIRRIVRVISVLAWASLVAGVAGGLATLPDSVMFGFAVAAGVAAFAILQGLAWVVAGFSGNEKGADGLIRLGNLWPKKRSTPTPSYVPPLGVRRTNWKAWIVGVLAWVIGWSVVKYANPPVDPVRTEAAKYFQKPENQQQFVEIMGSLSKDPDFLAAVKQAKPGESMQLGAKLGEQGLQLLPDYMLLQRAYLYAQLLERTDTTLCARLVKGTTTSQDYVQTMAALETMSSNDVGNWLRLSRAAMDAALKKRPAGLKISPEQAEDALRLVTAKYTTAQLNDLLAFFRDANSLSDTATCQVGKDLYKSALAVPEAKKAYVARALVAD